MKITKEIFEQGKSKNGGWSGKQIRTLGIETEFNKGWKNTIWDMEFTEEQIKTFLELKDKHLFDQNVNKNKQEKLDFS